MPNVGREIFVVKIFCRRPFLTKIEHTNVLYNICQPIPISVAEVQRQKLDYTKNVQAKYFTSENILIYGM